MMEDMLIYSSNVAYQVCRDIDRVNLVDHHNDESVPFEINNEPIYTALSTNNDEHPSSTTNSQRLIEKKIDNLSDDLKKVKKMMIAMILFCMVLVAITITAIIISVLSYHLSQTNGGFKMTTTQEILQLDKRIQNNLASLQVQSYCGPGQWHRIAFLNMTDPSQQCPSAWREYNTSGVRACRRPVNSSEGCSATVYSTDRQYSRVCGRVIGYQLGSPDAFARIQKNDIDLDGVNITHGPQRNHIWSYVAGLNENDSSRSKGKCPCAGGSRPPLSIGNHYYCESGNPNEDFTQTQLYSNDPLWDGQQCEGACCNSTNFPPWFSVQLHAPTTDMIEVNICCDQYTGQDEDTPIVLLEMYIQ